MSTRIAATFLVLACASELGAQCEKVPNTGCPGALQLECAGDPQIGRQASICWVPNQPPTQYWGVLFTTGGANIDLPSPFMCLPNCKLHGQILVDVLGGIGPGCVTWMVPNDPRLVGRCYCTQVYSFGIGPIGPCFGLSNALRGTILPANVARFP